MTLPELGSHFVTAAVDTAAAADATLDLLQSVVVWLRGAFVWIALSLIGGTLFALKRGTVGFRAWVTAFFRACVVGGLANSVMLALGWEEQDWRVVVIFFCAVGADSILILVDTFWSWAATNPSAFARWATGLLVYRRIVVEHRPSQPPPEHPPAGPDQGKADREKGP